MPNTLSANATVFKTIPGFPGYEVNTDGVVRTKDTHEVLDVVKSARSNRPAVFIKNATYKYSKYPIARLVLLAFDATPIEKTFKYSVHYTDGNENNYTLDNINWTSAYYFPTDVPGINCSRDTLVTIPGYTRYKIDIHGNIYDTKRDTTKLSYTLGKNSRCYYSVYTDNGEQRHVARYRLLALTFIAHPKDTDLLVVNHIDGDPSNDAITNLEWVTLGENLSHAYTEGLRTESRRIQIRHIASGLVTTLASVQECARFFKTNPGYIHDIVTRKPEWKEYKGYNLRYHTEAPWKDAPKEKRAISAKPKGVAVFDCEAESVTWYPSLSATYNSGIITKKKLVAILEAEDCIPHYGKIFKACERGDVTTLEWPVYPRGMLIALSLQTKYSAPVKVTDLSKGTVDYYSNLTAWCAHHPNEIGVAPLSRRLKTSNNRYRHWSIEFVDPESTIIKMTKCKTVSYM